MQVEKGVLIAFGELFLKSERVKRLFKRKLVQNLSKLLSKEKLDFKVLCFRERIFVQTKETEKALKAIKHVPGISWLAESFFFKSKLKDVSSFIAKHCQAWIKKDESFAIRLKRSQVKESSEEIINEIAKAIDRKVDLENPSKELFVEARKEGYFLYFKKEKGISGLPTSTAGKVLALISGGIDSPVAAFLMAKRGAENVWIHFHSFPLVSNRSILKVRELARLFLRFQPRLKVYFIPFHEFQIKVKTMVPSKYRVIIYRRFMFKIAQAIAMKENCKALVTGESLGQVSSQTLPNLQIISEGIELPILRPLIGLNKEEIIDLAKRIGTYDISILPQEDCCSLFIPKHASAEAKLERIKEFEKKLEFDEMVKKMESSIEEYE